MQVQFRCSAGKRELLPNHIYVDGNGRVETKNKKEKTRTNLPIFYHRREKNRFYSTIEIRKRRNMGGRCFKQHIFHAKVFGVIRRQNSKMRIKARKMKTQHRPLIRLQNQKHHHSTIIKKSTKKKTHTHIRIPSNEQLRQQYSSCKTENHARLVFCVHFRNGSLLSQSADACYVHFKAAALQSGTLHTQSIAVRTKVSNQTLAITFTRTLSHI